MSRSALRAACLSLPLLALTLTGCAGEPPKPKESKPAKASCELAYDKLADTVWLRNDPATGKPDAKTRLKFGSEGGVVKAWYTTGSIGNVYSYTCTEKGGMLDCLETDPHFEGFCKAWASVNNGVCDPAVLAPQLGTTVDALKPTADAVNKELAALKPAAKEQQRKVDNSPGNRIRSHFIAAIDRATCGITLQDKFITMFNGKVQEYENENGTSNFIRGDKEYIWESCAESAVSVVDDAGKPVAGPNYPAGTLKFQGYLPEGQKAAASCTYTADVWADWTKASSDLPGTVSGPAVTFATALPFSEKGFHALYFDRYKTCDGKKERIGLTCGAFRIQ